MQQDIFQAHARKSRPETADKWDGLRYFQREACEAIMTGFEENRSQLLVMATGTGKTTVFGAIARNWPGNVLILAHRTELIEQAKARLEQMTGETVEVEMADRRASRKARLVVASLDTMRSQSRKDQFGKDHFGLVIQDECFPAGTLIDGVPIERVAEGDMVTGIDHATGMVVSRPVVRRFSKLASNLVTLYHGATSLACTGNHPVYVQRDGSVGYVQASRVKEGDLLCVWRSFRKGAGDVPADRGDVLYLVSRSDLKSDDGSDEPPLRVQAHDGAQSDETGGVAGEDVGHPTSHGARPEREAWERAWSDSGRAGHRWGSRLGNERGCEDQDAARFRFPGLLQTGRGEQGTQGGDRSGWAEPQCPGAPGSGREEGALLAWVRVDRVESHESTSPGGTRVYNLEVEGCHTYFANDTLVHNCHHSLAKSYRNTLEFFTGKLLGVTATPDRGDEKALGQVFDSVAYCFDILQGIEAGYLVPLRGTQVQLGEIQLDGLTKVAGDLAKGQLDEVMVRAVEGICSKTLELEPNRQGIGFMPGVKSAQYACERMNAMRPGSSIFISGDTDPIERARMVRDFKDGKFRYLWNCMVATEGFDAPAASLVIQARPTLSRALYSQMAGRGTRVLPGLVEHVEGRDGAAERRALIAASSKPDMCILDFVGNATKHALVTPTDLLGGDYSEEEVEEAKRKAKKEPGANPQQLLAAARAELAAVAAAVRSKAINANVQKFNPFAVLDVDLTSTTREDMRFGRQPPTEKQLAALERMKIPPAAIKQMSSREAKRLLAESDRRRVAGLATYAQIAQLKKFGLDAPDVSFKGAGRALTYVSQECNWQVGRVDAARLRLLATGAP